LLLSLTSNKKETWRFYFIFYQASNPLRDFSIRGWLGTWVQIKGI
jgi:hypothetical protein